MRREEVLLLLEKIKKELKIDQEIKLEFKDYKRLLANTSIKSGVIRLNKKLLLKGWVSKHGVEDHEKFIKKILTHELMHVKTKSKWHDPKYFWELL